MTRACGCDVTAGVGDPQATASRSVSLVMKRQIILCACILHADTSPGAMSRVATELSKPFCQFRVTLASPVCVGGGGWGGGACVYVALQSEKTVPGLVGRQALA